MPSNSSTKTTSRAATKTAPEENLDQPALSRSEAIQRLIDIVLTTKPKRRSSRGEN
jgi:hypothetical protein